jgi:hypothetical protein
MKRGICGQFALVYDEALKHTGIPSTLVTCLLAQDDSALIQTSDGHATNLVLLRATDGQIYPVIFDATGSPESQSRVPALRDLAVPAGLLGVLGISSLTLLLWRRRNSAWRIKINDQDINDQQGAKAHGLNSGSAVSTVGNDHRKTVDQLVEDWVIRITSIKDPASASEADLNKPRGAEAWSEAELSKLVEELEQLGSAIEGNRAKASEFMRSLGGKIEPALEPVISAWLIAIKDQRLASQWLTLIQGDSSISKEELKTLQVALERNNISTDLCDRIKPLLGGWLRQKLTSSGKISTESALKLFAARAI